MYDEVRAYFATLETSREQFDAAIAALPKATRHVDGALCDYCQGRAPICDTFSAARRAAWAALAASSVPLVRWIADNAESYQDEAEIVLRALPASMAELDAIAEAGEWCGTWTEFRYQADRDGVLPVLAEASKR